MIAPVGKAGARILVVDDEGINRAILAAMLTDEGHEAVEAADGRAALAALEGGRIDLVLLDVVMPGMDGFEVCRKIREDGRFIFLPVVFVTSLDDRASRVKGKAAGADDFLNKPVNRIELFARVENLLKAKAYHDLQARQQELLEAEVGRMRDHLIHADRLATLGNLAAGVGHKLKNVVTLLSAALPFIREAVEKGQPIEAEDLKTLETVAQHVSTHATHLLNYGRPGPDIIKEEDLREIVTKTLAMLRTVGKTKYVEVEAHLPEKPVCVEVNRMRIEQVLVNLVGNAVNALDGISRGHKTVRVVVTAGDGRAVCRVEDNGCGIPKAVRENLFKPYFTTKAPGKGNGLGLAVLKNIVESYRGTVTVETEEGVGSAFVFELPLGDPAPA